MLQIYTINADSATGVVTVGTVDTGNATTLAGLTTSNTDMITVELEAASTDAAKYKYN
ncbi:hypothetical protein [Arcobacter peruensis]|uniref:hypothetical protein n=1 Tax=Arcobacter peruensis TaxID=2320140 RepID=UPI0013E0BC4C|nr:hypothetical protein [Arcobacter peruensis]